MENRPVSATRGGPAAASPRFPAAAGMVLGLWVVYTGLEALLQAGRTGPPLSTALAFFPGLAGAAALGWAGLRWDELFLRGRPLSRAGLLALLATVPLLLPVFLTGKWNGLRAADFFLNAPAVALSQVLYFRCALLPALLRLLPRKAGAAILLAALLHGLWHLGPVVQGAGWQAAAPVMFVPFLAGLAWNWQVRRDGTVLWVAGLHVLIDQAMSLFTWGG